jgi:hypothetical protein
MREDQSTDLWVLSSCLRIPDTLGERGQDLYSFRRRQSLPRRSDRHIRLPRHVAALEAIRLRDLRSHLPKSTAYTQRKTRNLEHMCLRPLDWEIQLPLRFS